MGVGQTRVGAEEVGRFARYGWLAMPVLIFWFVPLDVIWRIMDSGDRLPIREAMIAVMVVWGWLALMFSRRGAIELRGIWREPSLRWGISLMMVWLVWLMIGVWAARVPVAGMLYATLWIFYFFVWLEILLVCRREEKIRDTLVVGVAGLTVSLAVYMIAAYFYNGFSVPERLLNMVRLAFAECLLPGAFLIWWLYLSRKKACEKWGWLVAALIVFWALLESKHRSPLIGYAVGGLFALALLWGQRREWHRGLVALGLAHLLVVAVHFAPAVIRPGHQDAAAIEHRLFDNEPHSVGYRILLGKLSLNMALENPIAGVGTGNFAPSLFKYQVAHFSTHPEDPLARVFEEFGAERAHSEWMQTLAENGWMGLILISAPLLVLVVPHCRKGVGSGAGLAGSGAIAYLVCSTGSGFSWRWAAGGLIFFMVLGLFAGSKKWEGGDDWGEKFPGRLAWVAGLLVLGIAAGVHVYFLSAQYQYAQGYRAFYQAVAGAEPGKFREAAEKLNAALGTNPGHYRANQALAETYLFTGEKKLAFETLRRGRDLRVYGASHLILVARLGEGLNQPPDVVEKDYRLILKAYPSSDLGSLFLAEYLQKTHRGEAVRLVEKVRQQNPELVKGFGLYMKGDWESARRTLGKADEESNKEKIEKIIVFCK
ncbi:MAG: O-antigen ligase family protein [Verrucomicrobiae bacterium]|nr:O-antigen ligase family protein [Verrucomicrobiae bacterium]